MTYQAYTHPAATDAILKAGLAASAILETYGFYPPVLRMGDAAYDTTGWIDELEDEGYFDDTEARIARQVAYTAMHMGSGWRPRCLKGYLSEQSDKEAERVFEGQVLWEAEVTAAARRIKNLVRRQVGMFDEPQAA